MVLLGLGTAQPVQPYMAALLADPLLLTNHLFPRSLLSQTTGKVGIIGSSRSRDSFVEEVG